MTESIWLPYHLAVQRPPQYEWRPLCRYPLGKPALVYEAWKFIELEESNGPTTDTCEACKNHPDFFWHYLGSL